MRGGRGGGRLGFPPAPGRHVPGGGSGPRPAANCGTPGWHHIRTLRNGSARHATPERRTPFSDKNKPMHLTNLTLANEIGANSYLLETAGGNLLIDSGMNPKAEGGDALPDFRAAGDRDVQSILVSHAHLDHSGSIPVAMRHFPGAPVFMTELTARLVDAMLHNSVNVMTSQRDEKGIQDYPFFSHGEVDDAVDKWIETRVGRASEVLPGVHVEWFDAGHIPGSAGIGLRSGGKSLFYTGDVQFEDQCFCRGADFPERPVDVLLMETTRGATDRATHFTRSAEIERFAAVVRETFAAGGSVLVPVFALGKTQELLLMLHEAKESGLIPADAPVHLGGLGTKLTQIIDRFRGDIRRRRPELDLLRDTGVKLRSRKKRGPLQIEPGGIYALSSGMLMENTTSNEFASRFIDKTANSICFVGYSDPESPAGALLATEPGGDVVLDHRRPPVPLNCRVEKFDFSGHATREQLLEYACRLRPATVVLVHGDGDALDWFQAGLARDLPETQVVIPPPGERVELVRA